jgi:signal transduction histidine kinase
VLKEDRVTNYYLTARRQDGHETVVSYNATTFNDRDGKLQGVFAAARDITERKRFEQAVQEKNIELENASLAKDRFLASMSHELRTPLNSIIGFTGTLLMKLPGPLTADQNKQLKTIQGSGRHLLSLINDLLDLAKIESGKVDLDIEPVICNRLIEEVAASLKPQAEAKGLTFSISTPTESVTVNADRRALSQIVINLVNNAIKFTEAGEVRLELRPAVNGHDHVGIAVIDSGVGIRSEDQPKLFEAFSQVQDQGPRRAEGTGLGLHLSRKLAAMMSARIQFTSEYGRGSTFTVELPRA